MKHGSICSSAVLALVDAILFTLLEDADDGEVLSFCSISSYAFIVSLVVTAILLLAEVLLSKVFSMVSLQDFRLWAVLSLASMAVHALWITSLHMLSLVGGDVLGDLVFGAVDLADFQGSSSEWAVSCSEGGPFNVQPGHQKLM